MRLPLAVLAIAFGLQLVAIACATAGPAPLAVQLNQLQQLVAAAASMLALSVVSLRTHGRKRRICLGMAVGLALAFAGEAVWEVSGGLIGSIPDVSAALYMLGVGVAIVVLVPAFFSGLPRATLVTVGLDAAILFLAAIGLVAALWQERVGQAAVGVDGMTLVGAAVLLSASAAAFVAFIAKRLRPTPTGPWAVIWGLFLVGLATIQWLGASATSGTGPIEPSDFLFAGGCLCLGFGGVTWHDRPLVAALYERIATWISDGLPILAIVVSLALTAISTGKSRPNPVAIATACVVLLAAARQALLLDRERRARAGEHRAREGERLAAERLRREIAERADTVVALSRLEPATTVEATARRICQEALRLPGIDVAIVHATTANGDVVPLAVEGSDAESLLPVGRAVPDVSQHEVFARHGHEPWIEMFEAASPGPISGQLYAAGLRGLANASMVWRDRVIGGIALGCRSEEDAAALGERLATVREFGLVGAALLGPALAAGDNAASMREAIRRIIDEEAFVPVFQPIVELHTGRVVGFEALTRFADGVPPDRRFAEAAEADMSVALETACLRAAIADAFSLPGGWLSLNVSPALASALVPLIATLEDAPRDVVVEITEHAPIEDYRILVDTLGLLRGRVRLAVDDAGAGYAGLRHILELKPHFVKLDIALVRSIDADPARRAMVRGMTSFAIETGSVLIAEGIETEAEAEALRRLGVTLGQGYLLGRPRRPEGLAMVDTSPSDANDRQAPGQIEAA